MRTTDRDDVLARLVRDETYRSPDIPTRRFGADALVSVTSAMGRQHVTTSEAPEQWLVTDAATGDIVAFASTSLITPLPAFEGGAEVGANTALTVREGLATIREVWEPIQTQFLGKEDAPADARRATLDALDAVIPVRLQPWIKECCVDFFDWLQAP